MPSYTSPTGYSPFNDQVTSSISHPVGTYSYPLTTLVDYQVGSVPVYVGYAIPGASQTGASWAIQFIQYNGSSAVVSTTWSSNYMNFGDIWANRATLTYA
jgi:hypothetical protein